MWGFDSLLWYLMMDEAHPFSLAIIFTSVGSRLYSLFQKTWQILYGKLLWLPISVWRPPSQGLSQKLYIEFRRLAALSPFRKSVLCSGTFNWKTYKENEEQSLHTESGKVFWYNSQAEREICLSGPRPDNSRCLSDAYREAAIAVADAHVPIAIGTKSCIFGCEGSTREYRVPPLVRSIASW